MALKRTCLKELYIWSAYQPDKEIDFNGFFWRGPDGGLLIDPLPLDPAAAERVRAMGGAAWILLTNADHLRAATELKEGFGAQLLAPAADRERLGEAAAAVDVWFTGDDDLPDALRRGVGILPLPGGKTPGECAVYLKRLAAVLFGDNVRSHASGELTLLPDAKLADRAALLDALRRVLPLRFDAVLLGDGDCIFRGGKEVLRQMLETLPGAFFNRINLDRVELVPDDGPPGAQCEWGELSRHMTCRQLGFHLEVLPPGNVSAAYHYETSEEELFLVRKGSMTVRTPQGSFEVGEGDIFVFPSGPAHAHQLRNDGPEPCEFLALSTMDPRNLTHYPDSSRIMVGERSEIYRIRDRRDSYWEDEPPLPEG